MYNLSPTRTADKRSRDPSSDRIIFRFTALTMLLAGVILIASVQWIDWMPSNSLPGVPLRQHREPKAARSSQSMHALKVFHTIRSQQQTAGEDQEDLDAACQYLIYCINGRAQTSETYDSP